MRMRNLASLSLCFVLGSCTALPEPLPHRWITLSIGGGYQSHEADTENTVPQLTLEQDGPAVQAAVELEPVARTEPLGVGLRLRGLYFEEPIEVFAGGLSGRGDAWRWDLDFSVRLYLN